MARKVATKTVTKKPMAEKSKSAAELNQQAETVEEIRSHLEGTGTGVAKLDVLVDMADRLETAADSASNKQASAAALDKAVDQARTDVLKALEKAGYPGTVKKVKEKYFVEVEDVPEPDPEDDSTGKNN